MFEMLCLYGIHSASAVKGGLCVVAFILVFTSLFFADANRGRLAGIFLILSGICMALAVFSPSEETYKAWLEVARRP